MYKITTEKGDLVIADLLLRGYAGVQLGEKIREYLDKSSKSSLIHSEDPTAKEFMKIQLNIQSTSIRLEKAISQEMKIKIENELDILNKENTVFYNNNLAKIIEISQSQSTNSQDAISLFMDILIYFKVDSNLIDEELYAIGDYQNLIVTIASEERNYLYSFLGDIPRISQKKAE